MSNLKASKPIISEHFFRAKEELQEPILTMSTVHPDKGTACKDWAEWANYINKEISKPIKK